MDAEGALGELKRLASKTTLAGMARYGIPSKNALGVPVGKIQQLAQRIGKSHTLALELWDTGVYEARLLAAYVGEPEKVTRQQMDAWCRDFDSWAVVDTICFVLFDRSPLAFGRIGPWAKLKGEFQRRAGFALLACLALHHRDADDGEFARHMGLIEKSAGDERNFVKKGVSWALRSIGRRSLALHTASLALASELSCADSASARWVGKDALRDLSKPAVRKKLAARK